jgi:DNA-binding NtrC family response regulator
MCIDWGFTMDRCKVLLIGVSPALNEALRMHLSQARVCLCILSQVEEAASVADDPDVALVVLAGTYSFCQPFLGLFAAMHPQHAATPLMILASGSSEVFAIASLRAGALEYLPEPIDAEAFIQSTSRWLPTRRIPRVDPELTGGAAFVGSSPAMQALRAQIRRVAATDCNVLITGETGTGKEVVAQLIHQNSPRSKNPFVCINCAAIPDSLLESELFGFERGAFTGAARANEGKLMSANRGTVFFDEVGDMSSLAQAKVLRAIETKEVQRLGASRACDTDIRIVAATHRNLDGPLSPEALRRDLYFRLNVGRIYLPPLRERKADVASLVERMVVDLNAKFGRRIEGVSGAAMRSLVQHDWPGNVRELRNVIERAFITREDGVLSASDLSVHESPRSAHTAPPADHDLRCLQEALSTCNGNKSKAAEKLNWSRMTLYRKLAKYGMGDDARNSESPANR